MKTRVFILLSYILLAIIALSIALFRIEGFAYTCTCTENAGSASVPTPAKVDITPFYMKPPPASGCPTGLVELIGATSKFCGCPAESQKIVNGQCSCPDKSTYTPWVDNKGDPFSGRCVCNTGTTLYRGGCVSECPKDMVSKVNIIGGLSVAICQFP